MEVFPKRLSNQNQYYIYINQMNHNQILRSIFNIFLLHAENVVN